MQKLLVSMITASIIYFLTVGILLIVSSNGYWLGVPLSILNNSVFKDFELPGWIMIGISVPLLIALFQNLAHRKYRYNWAVFSGFLMLLFSGLQFNYIDTSIWLDILLIAFATFILLTALKLKGTGLI